MSTTYARRNFFKILALAPLASVRTKGSEKPAGEAPEEVPSPWARNLYENYAPGDPVTPGRLVLRFDDDPEAGKVWMVEYGLGFQTYQGITQGVSRIALFIAEALPWGQTISDMMGLMNTFRVDALQNGLSPEREAQFVDDYSRHCGSICLGRLSAESTPAVHSVIEETRKDPTTTTAISAMPCSDPRFNVVMARCNDLNRAAEHERFLLRIRQGSLKTDNDLQVCENKPFTLRSERFSYPSVHPGSAF